MEPNRVPYSPIVDRPILNWPAGARIAVWLAPNIEHYEYVPARSVPRNPWPRMPHPDVLGFGWREYGNRAGFWRFLDIVDRHDVPCSAMVNVGVLQREPQILAACEERGWEYVCHGMFNTRYLWSLDEPAERQEIDSYVDAFAALTGRRFKGWFSPALSHTTRTADIIAEKGFEYWCDWAHDDQPFPFRVRSGWMMSVPYSLDVNDGVLVARGRDGDWIYRTIVDAFDTLYAEGSRVLCIAVHPYLIGQPHRIAYLDRALSYIKSHDGVWFTTAGAIASWYRENYWATITSHLGIADASNG